MRAKVCFLVCCILCVIWVTYLLLDGRTLDGAIRPAAIVTASNNITQSFPIVMMYEKRFPGVIIMGVKKCGTTALRGIMKNHPSIKVAVKEIGYFSNHDNLYRTKNLQWYVQQMPFTMSNQTTVEKTPYYFTSVDAPKRLKSVASSTKLLLIVRNPLIRAVSEYLFQGRPQHGGNKLGFTKKLIKHNGTVNAETLEVRISMYDIHYKEWLKWFPKEQILIVNGDNLKTNPVKELRQIEEFMNVTHFYEEKMFDGRYFKGKPMAPQYTNRNSISSLSKHRSTMKKIAAFLQPHAREFCRIASVNFTWCKDMYLDSHVEDFM